MRKTFIISLVLMISAIANSQTYKLTWGEDIKLKKGSSDLDIVAADNTGLFFTETRLKLKNFLATTSDFGESIKLIKLDKNFGEVFDRTYKKELKGLVFHSFQPLENDLYLYASDYEKKKKEFKIYGAKVDKNSGDLDGDFRELGTYSLESKKDDYDVKVSPVLNGKNFLLVSNISGKDRVSLGISILDKNFNKKVNTVINLSNNPAQYRLEDVQYTKNNKIILLGREYEDTQYGKKKRKRNIFKRYTMSIYAANGTKEKDIVLNADERFIISGKLIEQPAGGILLAGFYSNTSKKEDLNGFFINKVDDEKGELTLSSFKEIDAGMLGQAVTDDGDDDDEIKENKKLSKKAGDDGDADEFPNSYSIKSVDINPADNSVIITSEISSYKSYSYITNSFNSVTHAPTSTTNFVYQFLNRDLLIIGADKDGGIKWLNAMPKLQDETIRTSSPRGTSAYAPMFDFGYDLGGYFARSGGMPFYSSYISMLNNNKLVLILNDHISNNVNPEYGAKVKAVINFRKKSNVYGISVDLATGKMERKFIVANRDETILMPRHAFVVNNEIIVPSWRIRAMAKTELKFAKIIVK